MTRSDAERVTDVIEACREASALVDGGRDRFDADRTVQLALERLLEIIGEATNALTDDTKDRYTDIEWRDITPVFHGSKPPADWLMVAEVAGRVFVVPLAPPASDDPASCRPIGCYEAAEHLARRYRKDR